jgi:hypothetical protein
MKARQIKTQADHGKKNIILSGWLDGKGTYLWIGDKNDNHLDTLSGYKLYRLAKAIVKQFEIKEKK